MDQASQSRALHVPISFAAVAAADERNTPWLRGLYVWPAVIAAMAWLLAAPALAAEERARTAAERPRPEEVRMLPKYCQARMGNNSPENDKYWTSVMGPTYQHIHHYCRGLVHTNRGVMFLDPRERQYALKKSIDEFDYVLRHAPQNFVLLPELLTKRGDNLIRLGRIEEGTENLRRAMDLKSDYWPPYAAMSDYYRNIGDASKAREWLDKALAIAPNAKALQMRVTELQAVRHKPSSPPPEPAAELDKSASAEPSAAAKEEAAK